MLVLALLLGGGGICNAAVISLDDESPLNDLDDDDGAADAAQTQAPRLRRPVLIAADHPPVAVRWTPRPAMPEAGSPRPAPIYLRLQRRLLPPRSSDGADPA